MKRIGRFEDSSLDCSESDISIATYHELVNKQKTLSDTALSTMLASEAAALETVGAITVWYGGPWR